VDEQVQTLADGTHISRQFAPTKVYRDSVGRIRRERTLFRGSVLAGHPPDAPILVEITDPAAHVKYTLDSANKIAHRQQMAAPPNMAGGRTAVATSRVMQATVGGNGSGDGIGVGVAGAGGQVSDARTRGGATGPRMTNEKLGTETIGGVPAEGFRHTTTWPVDSQGNDRPISTVNETWRSRELQVTILSKYSDPRTGEHTQKLINIRRDEPLAELFQPPPDYSIVDETGEFTIKWESQQ
jgi:hypothetical protein